MIGESGITNICDVMRTVENDDSRGFGAMMTLPLFFPFFTLLCIRKYVVGFCTVSRW